MIKSRKDKWQPAFATHERTSMLRKHISELERIRKPELIEDRLEEMNYLIAEAMEYNQSLSFTYYVEGEYRSLIGNIHYYDSNKGLLHIIDNFHVPNKLELADIVDMHTL
ncbi:YolD-like family protein [Robertmurraya yapensis]|uniref:YolD-like family protein n=2 Tax=Bacillaceae TaxID=186817 RepID=A0A431VYD3_9BACI|nr:MULTISPECIES: YolD-like family protein [Bacillaceae]RTR28185.1 YolD-like family protein [Bacillus yapensis]TKC15117.1 YolD-like family protein [Robertmurraya kyonggiensis]TKS94429.1 YolD-like family protein [Bacillus yapensis]